MLRDSLFGGVEEQCFAMKAVTTLYVGRCAGARRETKPGLLLESWADSLANPRNHLGSISALEIR